MPLETTVTDCGWYTSYSTYSYSECGNYDYLTGHGVCKTCGITVFSEYYCEENTAPHIAGRCIVGRSIWVPAVAMFRLANIYKPCSWCQHNPCDCPF